MASQKVSSQSKILSLLYPDHKCNQAASAKDSPIFVSYVVELCQNSKLKARKPAARQQGAQDFIKRVKPESVPRQLPELWEHHLLSDDSSIWQGWLQGQASIFMESQCSSWQM